MTQATQEHITALARAVKACHTHNDACVGCPGTTDEGKCVYGSTEPDLTPTFDLSEELWNMLAVIEHLVYSNHGYKPEACSACAQAQLYVVARATLAKESEEQG